jgi:two-component system response regulator MprA
MDLVRKTVLIIEDNDIAREGLAVVLSRHGYDAVITSNGQQALKMMLGGLRPDLVLLDMLLPEKDGWAFMKELHGTQDLARTPVVIITALPVGSTEWSESLGAVGFLRKPIETEQLLREVSKHVSSTQS